MLKLTQTIGDSIYVFDKDGKKILRITYTKQTGKQISLGFDADDSITILREKVLFNKDRDEIIKNPKHQHIKNINGNVKSPDDKTYFLQKKRK